MNKLLIMMCSVTQLVLLAVTSCWSQSVVLYGSYLPVYKGGSDKCCTCLFIVLAFCARSQLMICMVI